MSTPEKLKEQTLTNHTRVTVGLLVVMLGGVIGGVAEWEGTRAQIARLEREQWTVTDELQWTSEMQKRNPSIDVPIPKVAEGLGQGNYSLTMLMRTNSPEP